MCPAAAEAASALPLLTEPRPEPATADGRASDTRIVQALAAVAAIVGECDPPALARTVAVEAARLLNAEQATLFLLDTAGATLEAHPDPSRDASHPRRLHRGQGVAWAALAAGRPLNVAQAYADLRFDPEHDRQTGTFTRSILAAPVLSASGPLGVLEVTNGKAGPFDPADERCLAALCSAVAAAFENARRFADLQNMRRRNDSVLESMSRYMDPRLVGPLLEGGGGGLSGRSVLATMLFCDLRNSTKLAAELGAPATVSLLNEYFTLIDDCLRAEGGMLDKFIGDAVMAAFGIPVPDEDDEDRAVRAALAMTDALRRWNEARATRGQVVVEMGVGINTDTVVAGNVGSPQRMDYTVIGAGVNLAARLEKACKRYGTSILVSGHTVRRLKGRYPIRPMGSLGIAGKAEPVDVYEIIDDHAAQSFLDLETAIAAFARGVALRQGGRLADAASCFRTCLSLNPADRVAAIQLEACYRPLPVDGF